MHLGNGLTIPPMNKDILETSIHEILRTYNAQMWLSGPSNVAGNFVDSLGAVPLSTVNQVVGYVEDGTSQDEGENFVANSEMVGADGVTPPTLWTGWTTNSGITTAYLGTGVDSLGRYIDFRVSGTASANVFPAVAMAPNLTTPIVDGEIASMGIYHQVIGGSFAGTTLVTARLQCLTSGGVFVSEAVGAQPTTERTLCTLGRVMPATTAFVRPAYQVNVPSGNTVDITIRVWKPWAMKGNLGPYLPTTGTQIYRTCAYIPLNQPTTGFKPILNGAIFNYCARSKDITGWTPTRLALIDSVLYNDVGRSGIFQETASASLQHFVQSGGIVALPVNTVCHYSILVRVISGSTNIRLQSRKNDGATFPLINVDLDSGICAPVNGAIAGTVEPGPYGFKKVTMTWDTGAGSSICVPYVMTDRGNNNDGSAKNAIEIAQAFVGVGTSYSGPVPVTSNSPIQSADIVPYSWDFDGVDDQLTISKLPLLNDTDHFILAAFKMPPVAISVARSVVGFGNAGAQERLQLVFLSSNVINCFWRDAAGVATAILSGQPARAVNEKLVVTMRRKTGTLYGSVKGSVTAAAAGNTPVVHANWTPTLGFVGASVSTGAPNFFWEDEIYGIICGSGAPTDPELAAMENFLIGCAAFTPIP